MRHWGLPKIIFRLARLKVEEESLAQELREAHDDPQPHQASSSSTHRWKSAYDYSYDDSPPSAGPDSVAFLFVPRKMKFLNISDHEDLNKRFFSNNT